MWFDTIPERSGGCANVWSEFFLLVLVLGKKDVFFTLWVLDSASFFSSQEMLVDIVLVD